MSTIDRLSAIWRDLSTEPVWRYDELPPFLLSQLTEHDLLEASQSELARVIWFWLRRPKFRFPESVAVTIVGLCLLVSFAIVLLDSPRTSIRERVGEGTIILFEVALVIYTIWHRLKSVRWRREYERSIDRLIRRLHPEV
jgi:hypothetical protein